MYLCGGLLKILGVGPVRGIVNKLIQVLEELQSGNDATDRDYK